MYSNVAKSFNAWIKQVSHLAVCNIVDLIRCGSYYFFSFEYPVYFLWLLYRIQFPVIYHLKVLIVHCSKSDLYILVYLCSISIQFLLFLCIMSSYSQLYAFAHHFKVEHIQFLVFLLAKFPLMFNPLHPNLVLSISILVAYNSTNKCKSSCVSSSN